MNLPACIKPRGSGRHLEVRCGKCDPCVQVRDAIYAMFDAGLTSMAIARKHSIAPRIPMSFRTSWRELREAKCDEVDVFVERPRCHCGLSIDADHTPETCDMRLSRSTGMGQMGMLQW